MAEDNNPVIAALVMDRSNPLGNTNDFSGRGQLHVTDSFNSWAFAAVGNNIKASYPDAITEVYQFRADTVLKFEITVTYIDDTKALIDEVRRTA